MSGVKQVCHCSHDIDTHHEKVGSCLAARCDCPKFRDRSRPDVGTDVEDEAPITEPYPSSWPLGAWTGVRVQPVAVVTKVRA